MLQVHFIRENKEETIKRLEKKHVKDASSIVSQIIDLDDSRRKIQNELDNTLAESNSLAAKIGELFKSGKTDEANVLKAKTSELKDISSQLKLTLTDAEKAVYDTLVLLPNLPHHSVPEGRTPEENKVLKQHGDIPTLHAGAVPHWGPWLCARASSP